MNANYAEYSTDSSRECSFQNSESNTITTLPQFKVFAPPASPSEINRYSRGFYIRSSYAILSEFVGITVGERSLKIRLHK